MVKAWVTDCWYVWAQGEIFIENYPKIPSKFSRVSFDTEKLNRKHREVFALLSFVSDKEEFSLLVDIHDWTEAKHDCKPLSTAAEFPDAKKIYTDGCRQHTDGEGKEVNRSWCSTERRRAWKAKDLNLTLEGLRIWDQLWRTKCHLAYSSGIYQSDTIQTSRVPSGNPKPTIKSSQEDSVVYGIKGSREVKNILVFFNI